MSTLFNVNWQAMVAALGGVALVVFMLLLIAYVQLWRHRIQRALRDCALPAPPGRSARDGKGDNRILEYLENANFSNEAAFLPWARLRLQP